MAYVVHSWHRLAHISLADIIILVVSNDSINIDDPQAPGSHEQILANNLTEGLCACGPLMALIGSYFLVVPAFPCPLSSQEIDVGIALRKDEADGRQLFYGSVIDLITHSLYKGLCSEMGAVRISSTLHHSFYCVGVMNFL